MTLFVELKKYLDLYHNGSEEVFPDTSDVKKNGHHNLHALIRIHGGKVLIARKLSMKLYRGETDKEIDIHFGPITLNFAIRLLHFIRHEFMAMSPPLAYPMISMPLEQDLLRRGQDELASLVTEFGGYENIARRLGLAYFDGDNRRMNDVTFKGAKYLWKRRNAKDSSVIVSMPSIESSPNQKIKRKGVAWTKDVVVSEL